ncbi:MAG: hypothetical protein U1E83_01175 [Methylotetracoccus sp.]
MASSRVSTAITWSAASSVSLNSTSVIASDAFSFHVEDWEADIQISCDNAGTPASGDYVDLWIAWTAGDLLGDSSDDFDTNEYAEPLGRIDTVAANTPGEDPARRTFHLPSTASKGFKLLAKANQGATRAITLRAMISAHRGQ